MQERGVVWAGRVAWAALVVSAAPALGPALDDWDAVARTAAAVGLWVLWAVALVAALVPHPVALTTWRVLAPASAVAVAMAALDGHPSAVAALNAASVIALAYAPATGAVAVNGPAYANERRFPLRPPGVALLGAMPAWAILVGGPTVGALLLANRRWIAGALALGASAAAGLLAARALHGLARRWLVFVPAGVVLHDPMALADPVLLLRATIASIGPAPAEAAAARVDLTGNALGLALELRLREPATLLRITRPGRRPTAESTDASALLAAPTRAAAVLEEAATRGYRVA